MKSVNILLNLLPTELKNMLEISQFNNANLLYEFLEILGEPDFNMISHENIQLVANKILERDPNNKLAIKYIN
ncbi:TPA: hypothetical protein O8333_000904 [Staphylococcus aureus]|nr:hypothetical protein [Staphylococcus aureus]